MDQAQNILNTISNKIRNRVPFSEIQMDFFNLQNMLILKMGKNLSFDFYDGSRQVEPFFELLSQVPLERLTLNDLKIESFKALKDFIDEVPVVELKAITIADIENEIEWNLFEKKNHSLKIVNLKAPGRRISFRTFKDFSKLHFFDLGEHTEIGLYFKGCNGKQLILENLKGDGEINLTASGCYFDSMDMKNVVDARVNLDNCKLTSFSSENLSNNSLKVFESAALNFAWDTNSGVVELESFAVKMLKLRSRHVVSKVEIKSINENSNLYMLGKYGKVTFDLCKLGDVNFSGSFFDDVVLQDSTLVGGARLNGSFLESAIFKRVTFGFAPVFDKEKMCINTHFIECKFLDYSANSISRYRLLKNKFAEDSNELEESLFASYELEARSINTTWKNEPFFKFCSMFYSFFNSFGRSIERPLFVYFLLMSIYACIYAWFGVSIFTADHKEHDLRTYWGDFIFENEAGRVLLYSFFNSLGPLRYLFSFDFLFIQSLWGKGIVFTHNILASVNLYLLVAGIKKRFKQS